MELLTHQGWRTRFKDYVDYETPRGLVQVQNFGALGIEDLNSFRTMSCLVYGSGFKV